MVADSNSAESFLCRLDVFLGPGELCFCTTFRQSVLTEALHLLLQRIYVTASSALDYLQVSRNHDFNVEQVE
jgi:hypothetical protein